MKWILRVPKCIKSSTPFNKVGRADEKGTRTLGLQKLELTRAKIRIKTLLGNIKQKLCHISMCHYYKTTLLV